MEQSNQVSIGPKWLPTDGLGDIHWVAEGESMNKTNEEDTLATGSSFIFVWNLRNLI